MFHGKVHYEWPFSIAMSAITGGFGYVLLPSLETAFRCRVHRGNRQPRLSVEATDDSPEVLTSSGRAAGDEFQRTMGAFFAIYWLFRPSGSVDIWLVVTGTWILLFHILGIMIPFDYYFCQRGWNHQPDMWLLNEYERPHLWIEDNSMI